MSDPHAPARSRFAWLRRRLGLNRFIPAQEPLARALSAHARDGRNREIHVLRGEGFTYTIDSDVFFGIPGSGDDEPAGARPTQDQLALETARGRVLDVGAGAGRHTLALQARGLACVAIDVSPTCVALMRERGVTQAECVDVFQLADAELGRFDTVLFLMQSIGISGSRFGLEALLEIIAGVLEPGGQVLLDSSPLQGEAQSEGGEVEVQFAYDGDVGEAFSWLYLAYPQLEAWTRAVGWRCEKLGEAPTGDYLARLTKPGDAASQLGR